MSDYMKDEDLPIVADTNEGEQPVIDLLRAACWEKPTGDTKQPVKRLTKE